MGDLLKDKDLKRTKSRIAVLSFMEANQKPFTAEEIYQALAASKEVENHFSLSTIYRTTATLFEKGLLLKNVGADGVTHYQLNNSRHCHYLVCTGCSQVIPVESCPLHNLEESLSQTTGYQITGHHLEFFGLCPQCAQEKKR